MKATSALQAATEYGGFDLMQADGMTADDVREYFEANNFYRMFGSGRNDDQTDCGGYSFDECANAVIEHLGL